MKKVSIRLNGKDAVLGGPGPIAQRVIDFVKAIKDGEYFDATGISESLKNVTRSSVEQHMRKHAEEVEGQFATIPGTGSGRQTVYGSKKGIAKLKVQLEIE